ncbi:MAG: peroxidase-related enzyme [Balneolaceae bacterium]
MPFIDTISYEDATGEIKEVYDNLISSRGKLAEVHKIQSLNPPALVAHMDLYMSIMFKKSPLKRKHREMIAVVVSAANECEYCIRHHAEALQHFWKDEARTNQLAADFTKADLDETELALCQFAHEVTLRPGGEQKSREERIKKLKVKKISDRAILDAMQVIAYFNFVNRIVLGLGVDFTEDEIKGYSYD